MGNLLGRKWTTETARQVAAVLVVSALLAAAPSPALARELKVPEGPIFDAAAARDFPRAVYDLIKTEIIRQTTFTQVGPKGLTRWSARTFELIDFVKSPSPTYPDTFLFAMRYSVSISDGRSPEIYASSCQVVVVYRDGEHDQPTVVCEPVDLDRPRETS